MLISCIKELMLCYIVYFFYLTVYLHDFQILSLLVFMSASLFPYKSKTETDVECVQCSLLWSYIYIYGFEILRQTNRTDEFFRLHCSY